MTTATIKTIDIKLIHPTNNSDIEIGCPENILLKDIFEQLIDANFLNSGQLYTGLHKTVGKPISSILLNNDKSVCENGIGNNDIIQILVATQAGGISESHTSGYSNLSTSSSSYNRSETTTGYASTSEIKILGITNIPKVSFDEML